MSAKVVLNGIPQYWTDNIPYIVYINGYRRSDVPCKIDDQFFDALAAGSVNGTYGTPGPRGQGCGKSTRTR